MDQPISFLGTYPPELTSQTLIVTFQKNTDSTQYFSTPATWASPTELSVVLPKEKFPDVCDVSIQITIQGERSGHWVTDPGTPNLTLISLYRLSSPINTLIPSSFGGESFIVVDNVPDRLSTLTPSVMIGTTKVDGRLRTAGPNNGNITGISFTAPPLAPGHYPLKATLKDTAIAWGIPQDNCQDLYYYQPLPGTEAQAFGISLTANPSTGSNPFVFKADPNNKVEHNPFSLYSCLRDTLVGYASCWEVCISCWRQDQQLIPILINYAASTCKPHGIGTTMQRRSHSASNARTYWMAMFTSSAIPTGLQPGYAAAA